MALFDPDTEKAITGEIRLSSVVTFFYKDENMDEYEPIQKESYKLINIPERGVVALIKIEQAGRFKFDYSIISNPVEDLNFELPGKPLGPIVKPKGKRAKPGDELFEGFM
ncbi:MAG: hypothetical protein KW793_04000 [Candidatus Doudnabacteria bacterium]|nr:hypothetical protein [Candidatus Doudnabacteria bacterium]